MKDFTKKGTKLPVIPVGTEYRWLEDNVFRLPQKGNRKTCLVYEFISFGKYIHKKEVYIKCEGICYDDDWFYLIKLSTIERLAKEQGMCEQAKEKEALEIASKIIREALQSSQSLLKSQQMKTQVTLNDNGGVTVTENNTTTIHSKETALQIYEVVLKSKGLGTVEYKGDGYYNINFP